jgi:hypothetical protein
MIEIQWLPKFEYWLWGEVHANYYADRDFQLRAFGIKGIVLPVIGIYSIYTRSQQKALQA